MKNRRDRRLAIQRTAYRFAWERSARDRGSVGKRE
jgi:hypothetical protein